jgi:DNA-binding NarL/FixJ family response regulator
MEGGTIAAEAMEWPLVGREDELARIEALRRGGAASAVVLVAPAGVGKSSLARHAVAAAQRDGAFTGWVQATRSAATIPLGALAALLPDDAPYGGPLELMRSAAGALRERAAGRPVALGIDDAQLLDAASAAMVLHLVMSGTAFVIATVRSGEPLPDAVEELWKDAGAVRLELGPLDETRTGRLVETVLGAPVEEAARRWMHDRSRGNILYVRELLLGALADGALEDRHGFWRLARRPRPSASLVDIIGERLAELGKEERRALELLAMGEPMRLEEMEALVGADALSAVDERGLISVEGATSRSAVRVAHPLYGEVVRDSMSMMRAHDTQLRLAEIVERRADRSPRDALRVACWLLDAGRPVPADLAVQAAGAAVLAGDGDLGARLALVAREGGAGAVAGLLLGRAESLRNDFEAAERVLAELEGGVADRGLALEYLELRATVLFWGLRRVDDALTVVERGRGWWPEPEWERQVEPLRLYLVFLAEGPQASLTHTESLVGDPHPDPRLRRRMEMIHAANLFFSGRGREAHAMCLRLRPSIPLRDVQEEVTLDVCGLVGLDTGEDLAELDDWLSRTVREGVRANDHTAAALTAMNLAVLRMMAGRFVEAARWADEAVIHLERRDTFNFLPLAHATVTVVANELGDTERAEAAIALCRAAQEGRKPHETEWYWFGHAEAAAQAAAGDPPAAQRTLLETADKIDGLPIFAARLTYEALRRGARPALVSERLGVLAGRCDAPLVEAYVAHAAALAAGDGAALLEVAERLAEIGAARFACEAAAHAADAFAADGRQDSARRAAARCRELHAAGEGGRLPAMAEPGVASTGLTAREAQLVELASRGLTNAEIAERLVLSVRTVETHIYRAMQKLGISDRRDF